jgi:hypothetical protein
MDLKMVLIVENSGPRACPFMNDFSIVLNGIMSLFRIVNMPHIYNK